MPAVEWYPADEILRKHLVALAEIYAKATKATITAVGERVLRDWKFFERMKSGEGSCTFPKADQALKWFSFHWPDDTVSWPTGIPRPPKSHFQPKG